MAMAHAKEGAPAQSRRMMLTELLRRAANSVTDELHKTERERDQAIGAKNANSAELVALKTKVEALERDKARLTSEKQELARELEAALSAIRKAAADLNTVGRKRKPSDDGGAPPARRMHAGQ